MNKTTIVSAGQSLVDVALQELGTVASLFDLADAAGLSITDVLTPGQRLPVPASANADTAVAGYFAGNAYRVNTGDQLNGPALVAPTGRRYFSSLFFNTDYFA